MLLRLLKKGEAMKRYKWSDTDIVEWSYRALPKLTTQGQWAKLEEELSEAEAEIGKNRDKWIEEMADVSVVATILEYRFRSKIGRLIGLYIDGLPERHLIMEARDLKMGVNVLRKWDIADGSYHHVESKDETVSENEQRETA